MFSCLSGNARIILLLLSHTLDSNTQDEVHIFFPACAVLLTLRLDTMVVLSSAYLGVPEHAGTGFPIGFRIGTIMDPEMTLLNFHVGWLDSPHDGKFQK